MVFDLWIFRTMFHRPIRAFLPCIHPHQAYNSRDMELTPLSWLLAFFPILTVMVLMLAFKWGGMRSSAASWIVTVIVSLAFFGGTWKILAWSQVKSIFLSFNLLYIIWGALLLYSLANEVGAIRMISEAIPHLSSDRSLQVLTIAFLLTSFLQGMGGFGVPVAVCAPILVSLGFSPILAVVLTAIGHSWAVAFGSMASAYESLISVTAVPGIQIAPYAAAFFALSHVPIAGIITVLSTGWKSLLKTMPAILTISAVMSLTLWVLVTNGLWSLGSIGPSLMGLLTMFLITRLPAYRGKADPASPMENKQSFLLTIIPYILLVGIGFLIILIKPLNQFLSRAQFSLGYPEVVSDLGLVTPAQQSDPIRFFSHPGSVLMYSILISSLIFHFKGYFKVGALRRILSRLTHSAIGASLGVITMVGVSTIMTHTGMTSLIARGISEAINRSLYPAVSPFLGALGAFLTGSNSNSNILFGVIQKESAQLLNLSVPLILAGQNAGASFASVMSPAKLIVSCTTVGLANQEGIVLRKLLPLLLVLISLAAVAMFLWAFFMGAGA